MFSYGYGFRPWDKADILASGDAIKRYLGETIDECAIRDRIRFGTSVRAADWRGSTNTWHVAAVDEQGGETHHLTCDFLVACTGYYRHEKGYMPEFAGVDDYEGTLIHPQHWPEDLDYRDKNVVVIGSGATAVTIVPAIAGTTEKVTIVQRSPSYFYSIPARDRVFLFLRYLVGRKLAGRLARKRSFVLQYWLFNACRRWPGFMRRLLLRHVCKAVGPDVDMRHFTPRYDPWDERLCVVPEDDLFHALRRGDADIVTDEIDMFTRKGLRLKSGRELEADIIVSATGFDLQIFGGMQVSVDGQVSQPNEQLIYKGVLVEGVPNLAAVFGYINFTWTAKVELTAAWLSRLLGHLYKSGKKVVVPHDTGDHAMNESVMNRLNSGYVKRGGDALPRQGSAAPWQVTHDYRQDRKMLLDDPVVDDALEIR